MPEPEDPGRMGLLRPNRRFLYLLLAAVVVASVIRVYVVRGNSSAATLPTSCTTPALSLQSANLRPGDTLSYAITGPNDAAYGLYIDIAGVTVAADGTKTVHTIGDVPTTRTEQLLTTDHLSSCKAAGSAELISTLTAGRHTVTLFRLDARGATTRLASAAVTIT